MKPYHAENSSSPATYLAGFILALLLTVLAFGMVGLLAGKMPLWLTVASVSSLAILQILVHLRCFLHLKFNSLNYLNVQAILFTLFIISIMVGGTLWIMHALNYTMLPGRP